jgi:hypothetical protein
MPNEKGVEESLDQAGVSNIVREPRENPGQTKEGFHIGIHQMIVDLAVDFAQERKQHQFQTGLEMQKVRSKGIGKMAKGDLAKYLGRELQIPGRIVTIDAIVWGRKVVRIVIRIVVC